jgi:hypothetical protein
MKIFFILTCKKNKTKLEAMKKAWIPKKDSSSFKIFYVYGNPDNFKEIVEGRRLILPCVDSYQKLFLKTHGSFRFLSKTFPEAECIVKMDDDIYMNSFDSLLKNIDKLLDNDVNYFGNKLNFTHKKTDEERNILIPQWHFKNVTPDLHIPYRGKYPYSWAGGETYGLDMRTSKFISRFSDQDILNDSAFTRPFEDMSVALLAERTNNLKRGVLDDVSIRCQMTAEEILNAIK